MGIGAALVFPSFGHAYTNNWFPKGLMFLLAELGAAFMASEESTKVPGFFMLASLKILECEDVYDSALEYNRRLEDISGMNFSNDEEKVCIALIRRF